jgi:hypothetical protein
MLSCYLGDWAGGTRALERVRAMGATSKSFDDQSMVLLAVSCFRQRDSKALGRAVAPAAGPGRGADETRPRRHLALGRTLDRLLQRQPEAAVAALAELAADRLEPDFDLEAAWNLLTGLAATARENLDLAEAPTWVREVACASWARAPRPSC